jgi:hypothetical protein
MIREIKFRAWCDKGNQMHTPCEIYAGEGGEIYTRTGYKDDEGYRYNIHSNIQQFTGLQDINGTDIYEGDRVECWMDGEKFGELDTIEFNQGSFWLRHRAASLNEWIRSEFFDGEFKVIGNIYEPQ